MGRLVSNGCTGLDVSELQAALNFHLRTPHTPLMVDGNFGPRTEARVREFQKHAGITVDGIVGPMTIKVIYRALHGAAEANVTPRPAIARGRAQPVSGFARTAIPGLGQVKPANPDFVPPSLRTPQSRFAVSQGFTVESKLLFNPLSDAKDGEHPLRLTLTPNFPWPISLTKPLKLEIETANPAGKLQLDGKVKRPFELIETSRFELKPYFFVGAGVSQHHFKDINVGGGANVKLKLFENIGGSGVSVGLEADGGAKFNWEKETGEGKFKGFFEGGVILERRF